jgi:DNA-binding cell septation regulator SpoVG
VITIRLIDKGTVCAIADVGLGPWLVIKDFKIIEQPGQRGWVSPPSRDWQGTDGKRHFASVVKLTSSLRKWVEQAILEAWERSEGGRAHV